LVRPGRPMVAAAHRGIADARTPAVTSAPPPEGVRVNGRGQGRLSSGDGDSRTHGPGSRIERRAPTAGRQMLRRAPWMRGRIHTRTIACSTRSPPAASERPAAEICGSRNEADARDRQDRMGPSTERCARRVTVGVTRVLERFEERWSRA
jgi:hypothetical protein